MYVVDRNQCSYVGSGVTPDCNANQNNWIQVCCCAKPGEHLNRCRNLSTNAPVAAPPPADSWTIGQSTFTPGSLGDDNKATITASYELNLPVGSMSGLYNRPYSKQATMTFCAPVHFWLQVTLVQAPMAPWQLCRCKTPLRLTDGQHRRPVHRS
jgi:hypothetical protein